MGGEDDITIQTVTWPDLELPLPRNITEGEARGTVILTAKPIFDVPPTISEPEEALTIVPDVRATAFPGAGERTEEASRPWGFPEETTPRLGSATAFTSEDLVVQVTLAPGAAEVPGQPHLPGGKYASGRQARQLCPLLEPQMINPVTCRNQSVYRGICQRHLVQNKTDPCEKKNAAVGDLTWPCPPTRIKKQQSLVSRLKATAPR